MEGEWGCGAGDCAGGGVLFYCEFLSFLTYSRSEEDFGGTGKGGCWGLESCAEVEMEMMNGMGHWEVDN